MTSHTFEDQSTAFCVRCQNATSFQEVIRKAYYLCVHCMLRKKILCQKLVVAARGALENFGFYRERFRHHNSSMKNSKTKTNLEQFLNSNEPSNSKKKNNFDSRCVVWQVGMIAPSALLGKISSEKVGGSSHKEGLITITVPATTRN